MSASIYNSKLSNYVIVLLGVRASLDHEDGLKGVLDRLMNHSAIIVEQVQKKLLQQPHRVTFGGSRVGVGVGVTRVN